LIHLEQIKTNELMNDDGYFGPDSKFYEKTAKCVIIPSWTPILSRLLQQLCKSRV